MQVDSNVAAWITIWESITIPVWRFVLWPIEAFFSLRVPDWLQNYGTLGLVAYGMTLRFIVHLSEPDSKIDVAGFKDGWSIWNHALALCLTLALWPVWLLFNVALTVMYARGKVGELNKEFEPAWSVFGQGLKVFWETAVWFILLIAINYALLYKDGELRWQESRVRFPVESIV